MRAISCVLSAFLFVGPAAGESLQAPTGPVILTVVGQISEHNQGETAVFDLETLRAVGEVTLTTSTIWTNGETTFEGVSLIRLLERVGAHGSMLEARALNDYSVEIPLSDIVEDGPILAYRMNGTTMSVRDKGPIWIIYPYDQDPAYRTESTFARSVWQLSVIEVKE